MSTAMASPLRSIATDSLKFSPIDMSRHGKNPFGENSFRIVWAPTRTMVVLDSSKRQVIVPKYRAAGEHWILEGWMSGFELTHCTPEQWKQHPAAATLGEYPTRGDYECAHVFEACTPDDANIDKLVMWINESRKRSYQENRLASKLEYEAQEKSQRNRNVDRLRDKCSSFLDAPISGGKVSRGTKTDALLRSAQEVNMPTEEGFHAGKKPRKRNRK